jgi:hypothetical protein
MSSCTSYFRVNHDLIRETVDNQLVELAESLRGVSDDSE